MSYHLWASRSELLPIPMNWQALIFGSWLIVPDQFAVALVVYEKAIVRLAP